MAESGQQSTARQRLQAERKAFRENHPVGFVASPQKKPDGSVDLFNWACEIPGKSGTDWAGVSYKLEMRFPEDYPANPPLCVFTPALWHVNVFPQGWVCLSILQVAKDYAPGITVSQMLLGIQSLLDEPNPMSVANHGPWEVYTRSVAEYKSRVRDFVASYKAKYADAS